MKTLILIAISFTLLFATPNYTNCNFKSERYENLCNSTLKHGISVQYINEFLLSDKAKERDFKSFKLFQPRMFKTHQANEKRANNALVKFVPEIVEHLKKYRHVYDYAEDKYHVNREIVAAILAKETRLGKIRPRHDAFIVFNTLLLETKPNSKRAKNLMRMARRNMVSIIQFCYHNKIEPNACSFESSYAGAVGIPQFMPQNFIYIEGYKKEVGNLSDMNDAIVSASRFLHESTRFTKMINWDKIPNMDRIEERWYDYDFKNKNASFAYQMSKRSGKRYNCYACDKPELNYLSGYTKTIMRYNNSSNYAIGVLRLAYDAHRRLVAQTNALH